ncbi:MAG: hypothetical protein ACRDC6_32035 [Shewanella sp.]
MRLALITNQYGSLIWLYARTVVMGSVTPIGLVLALALFNLARITAYLVAP